MADLAIGYIAGDITQKIIDGAQAMQQRYLRRLDINAAKARSVEYEKYLTTKQRIMNQIAIQKEMNDNALLEEQLKQLNKHAKRSKMNSVINQTYQI